MEKWRDHFQELLNPRRISGMSEAHIVGQEIVQEVAENNKTKQG